MARIVGVDLPKEKRIEMALTYIYGVGLKVSKDILAITNISPDKRVKDLTDEDVGSLVSTIQKMDIMTEGDLRQSVRQNVKRLMDVGCYRGLRHRKGLPVRGQRTSTNARTRKGPVRVQVTKKKLATKK